MKVITKYKNMPIQAKASIWYTACNIFQKGISFIVLPIYTRLLTTTEYGEYSVFQSWKEILIIFATLNLYCGVFTKAMVDFEDDRDRYTSTIQGLSTVLTSCLFLIYIFAHSFWNRLFEFNTTTAMLLFLYFITFPSFSFWAVRQRVENRYIKMVVVTIIVSVLTPVISIGLLFYTNLRAQAVIWGSLIAQILVGLGFYFYNFKKSPCFFNKEYWTAALKFNIPLIPHYLSLIILGQADRIMIKEYCGNDKAGIYNLAYQVSMVMNIVVSAINSSLVPWIYDRLRNKDYSAIKKTCNGLCLLVGAMTMGAVLVSPEVVRILGTEEYLEAIWIIPSVATSVYFMFCYGLFSNIEFYFSATKFVMIASVIGAIVNVVLNVIFIPIYGFIAAGYTTLFCYFMFMIMHFLFMKKICNKVLDGELVFDIRFISLSCIIIILTGAMCMVLYTSEAIRYVVIAFGAILLVCFKNRIMSIIKTVRK